MIDRFLGFRIEPSSFGWDPPEKKQELFHKDSRYIVMLSNVNTLQAAEPGLRLAAFAHFRFEFDQDEELVYWWA